MMPAAHPQGRSELAALPCAANSIPIPGCLRKRKSSPYDDTQKMRLQAKLSWILPWVALRDGAPV